MNTVESPEPIYIVDDEAGHLRALCDTLGAHGFAATGFTSPLEALHALRTGRPPSLLLTDLMMPDMDGIGLLRAAQEVDPHLVGVLMTGHGTVATAVAAMKQGALDYVLKPLKLSTLVPVLRRALDIRRLRIENERLQHSLRARTLALEAANQELESFSYSVSHDLRTPLRAIGGYAEALVDFLGDDPSPDAVTCTEKLREGVARMHALIDDLLHLARTTQAELRRQPVDVSALAWEVVRQLQAAATDRRAEWLIAPDLRAHADPGLLRVVLENLLGNAWKYTGRVEAPRIELGLRAMPDGPPAFFVRDNGAGFDMQKSERLFRPFRRLHSADEFPGSGIGLATVQRIVQRHGGRIWPESSPGCGATFYFTLPDE